MLFSYILILYITHYIPSEAYTLTPPETLLDGETLTSQNGTFKLGFFTPSATSKNRYLGIWFNKIPVQTVVWVANRDSPIQDTSGFLNIDSTGNLNLVATVFNQRKNVVWSTNSSKELKSPVVEFLDSGNLVLRDLGNADSERYLWQSFDYPTDTVLPGMRLGGNRKTGMNWYVSSWMNFDDPSRGDYKWGLELDGYPEFIMRKGGNRYYRGGIWNGLQASGAPEWKPTPQFTYKYIDNAEETYFTYQQVNRSITMRLVMTQTNTEGYFQLMTWVDKTNSWILQFRLPRDRCDTYKLCGTYSSCDVSNIELCQCLKGFKPRSQEDWNRLDWSMGCERNVPIKCSNGEGFKKYSGVTLPQLTNSWVNASMNLEECRVKCLTNCSCVAYSSLDIRESGSGCILWFTDLSDMRSLRGARPDLYIRMAASEVRSSSNSLAKSKAKLRVTLIVTFASIGVLALGLGAWFFQKKRSMKGAIEKDIIELPLYSKRDDPELPLFDWDTILSATNNFSLENKLGEGGFGPVYKGVLDGEEIAVKRLSKNSIQGVNEFKNEVILISKLQHRNLVRILGCCIQGEEMTLIYEYMQNNSLDSYIFDETKSQLLDWEKRAQIIAGIARGLLYLHHDSRLRIIHRDLKASNILLDGELVAKISDFGLARIFGGDQMEARTRRVVGTRGYMSPEYAIDGNFSVKSDVFSFGVLVLEIISGKRNRGFFHPDHEHNLLGHAWRLWNENKSMELVHKSITSTSCVEEISRYIHIGLLCVQKRPIHRPTISAVALMLSSESIVLPQPQTPGFFTERSIYNEEKFCNSDNIDDTVTLLEGR